MLTFPITCPGITNNIILIIFCIFIPVLMNSDYFVGAEMVQAALNPRPDCSFRFFQSEVGV